MVPGLQGQGTGRRGLERDPPRPIPVVEIVKIASVEIAVVGTVVVENGRGGQGSRTIGFQWLYDAMLVRFCNNSLVCACARM